MKYFDFVGRDITLEFGAKTPIKAVITISDSMDKKVDDSTERLRKPLEVTEKLDILSDLIGSETVQKLIERYGGMDSYATDQLLLYVRNAYIEGKRKNLLAAGAGRARK